MVFMWMTRDQEGFSTGAMPVFRHIDMTEGKANRSEDVLARRSQESMFIRPGKGDATDGLPIVSVKASGRGTEHQVEFFARLEAIGHLGHHSCPEPVSPRGMVGVLRQQVDGHAETGITSSGLRGYGRARGRRERSSRADRHQKVLDAMASAVMRVCRMYWAIACMTD